MIARLQALIVTASVLAALAWLAWAQRAGLGAAAMLAGVALALLPQAPLLAIEFLLLAAFGRDAAAPRAGAWLLMRAWAGEVRASWLTFSWRQPFFARRLPDLPGGPGQTAVLLVHGYFCNRAVWTSWLRRLRAQGVPYTALTLTPAFGRIDDWLPAIDRAVAELQQRSGRPPLVVAHSMGGVVVRAWLAAQPDPAAADARVLRVITIGAPHQGTWMARFGHSPNARQLRPGHPWLVALAAAEPAARRALFTCFYSHADNIVFPASAAMLAGADNRHLPAVAHVDMVEQPAIWDEAQRWLAVAPAKPQ